MLPTEVVAEILQHVPERPRNSSCALVCRSWRTAAVAATNSITTQLAQQSQLNSLGVWMQRNGQVLEALSISSVRTGDGSSDYNKIPIPFQDLPQLQSLVVHSLAPMAMPRDIPNAEWCCFSQLTRLQLDDVHIHSDTCIVFERLTTQLSSLRHLQRSNLSTNSVMLGDVMQRALGTWTLLTCLMFDSQGFTDDIFNRLRKLKQLQQLQIRAPPLSPDTLRLLPLRLTHLDFNVGDEWELRRSTTPRLSQLTDLRHLAVSSWGEDVLFDPKLLSNLVQLQHLDLRDYKVYNRVGSATLSTILPQLQQLQHLSLSQTMSGFDASDCRTLVSSTQLTCLELIDCSMPANAVCHIFGVAGQCQKLQTLRILLQHYCWPGGGRKCSVSTAAVVIQFYER